jgi:hypothetical protein
MSENIGNIIPTQVPTFAEAADIRKAFNLYHYGTETVPSTVEALQPNSIAGYINDLQDQIDDLESGISSVTNLANNINLNDVLTTGFYFSTTSPTTALGYPENSPASGTNYARGYLHVLRTGTFVFQRYQTIGDADGGSNESLRSKVYWRSGNVPSSTATWTSGWNLTSRDGHLHNDTYYTISQIDSKISTTLASSRAAVVDSTGKITSSENITEQELNQLNGISTISTIQAQLNDRALASHNHDSRYYLRSDVQNPADGAQKTVRIFVQEGTPSNPAVGDLWFF